MEIRDGIHGAIPIHAWELPIIDSRYFQRLRQIKQLGFAEFSFPSATHNRYIHSLGAMHTATQAFQSIFFSGKHRSAPAGDGASSGPGGTAAPQSLDGLSLSAAVRFRSAVRLAALLHDVGHGPLSHTTEFAMPPVAELRIPGHPESEAEQRARKATHEDYTLKIILDSELTPILERAGAPHGFGPLHVAALVDPRIPVTDGVFTERVGGQEVDFRPILQQLISSELDADRMDYLRRDSWSSGVTYGQFDFDWLVGNLTYHLRGSKCFLGLNHRAIYSFEDFLISRFHMFLMVYFHHKSVVFDSMLAEYFASPDCDYEIPADIEKYGEYNDAHLYAHLARSANPWARRISEKTPYRMLLELHSGIPATESASARQAELLRDLRARLESEGVHYLVRTSTGELSKYFRKPGDSIYVRYDNHYSSPTFIPIEECTDLFRRYQEKRSITRLYVSPENFRKLRAQGRPGYEA